MPDPASPITTSAARPTGRVAAILALFSLPLSLFGIGGILGLIAIAMASRSSVRNANQRQAFATVIIGFVSVLLGGLVASSWMIGPGRYDGPSPIGTIQTGRVTTLDGGTFDLAGGDDRLTLVDVWATWCPPCIASIPMLEAIHRDLGDEVRVIGLSGESARTVRGWLERRTAEVRAGTLEPSAIPTYPIAAGIDPLPDLVRATQAYPTMYLLGPDGSVRQTLVGLHDLPTILAAIRASSLEPDDAAAEGR
ncbi:MAG: TlpA disulfide reductase family protein [Phycisphaerales bacterium]|jgi:thiol-disulfide isomerase/thioredoxin|nr:TlpA disulfide reductase family protein [Phycisphaerales bacterium]